MVHKLTKYEQSISLATAGVPSYQIAERIGSTRRSVSAMLSRARRCGHAIPYVGAAVGHGYVTAHLAHIELSRFRAEATKRGMGSTELASRVLAAVISDVLYTAVLDDRG